MKRIGGGWKKERKNWKRKEKKRSRRNRIITNSRDNIETEYSVRFLRSSYAHQSENEATNRWRGNKKSTESKRLLSQSNTANDKAKKKKSAKCSLHKLRRQWRMPYAVASIPSWNFAQSIKIIEFRLELELRLSASSIVWFLRALFALSISFFFSIFLFASFRRASTQNLLRKIK